MSNFAFLQPEWTEVHESALRAEGLVNGDPRASCFYARRTLELAVDWLYQHDATLEMPYDPSLSPMIHAPAFRILVGEMLFGKARVIKDLGNTAVHRKQPVERELALAAAKELFHFCYWLARTYTSGEQPPAGVGFDVRKLASPDAVAKQTMDQLTKLETELRERDEKLRKAFVERASLDEELQLVRDELAKTKAENAARPDNHDYSEAETRDLYIDLLLKEAGWALDRNEDREFSVTGMPNATGEGFVDYVLWGDDGKPLGLVEAKRTKRDARVGQQQAKLYADCLEAQFGQRPVIFYSNGYQHWIWDDHNYPPRAVEGFYKKDELELLIQRRTSRLSLGNASIDSRIVERYYQTRAIRRIGEAFEKDHDRKTLLVMATGAGKTRTVIALADLLMRCHWAKRILFLADRVALVNQAVGAFKLHLPGVSPVNLVTDKNTQGRVYVSTYPTMMGLIDQTKGGQREFGVGHFDLIVIDEAHRSVYQKYGAIFDYFDSLLVGLTATPKDEVDRNTYSLFELESGVPTDAYGLEEAVKDGYLVPARAVSVPMKFQREGIRYDDLPEDDKDQWDALEWNEDGEVPDRVEAEAVNKWLFNKDTVDKVLEHLMTRGQTVAGGDRLGKTIIFAKNHAHAEFIAERFNVNYPHYRGDFARVIDFKVEYAQSLIDHFKVPERSPHIAISVDMLDTGIDVPDVVNLVFFKLVRSKTKFWQMIGRGTRLRPDLFGPGKHKAFFYVFDYCQNLEYFSQDLPPVEGSLGESLAKTLFVSRIELVLELDRRLERDEGSGRMQEERARYDGGALTERDLRDEVAEGLREHVAGMNLDNFLVRPRRLLVETFSKREAWLELSEEQGSELGRRVAGLPTSASEDDEDAKRFDLLMLRLQLAILRVEPGFARMRDRVQELASALEEKSNIPMVRDQFQLIQEVQTEEFWEDVTAPILERVRKRLRLLIRLVEKTARQAVYTDFEDELGSETELELPGFGGTDGFERFRAKVGRFLDSNRDHISIQRIWLNQPVTRNDLRELERMLVEAGGAPDDIKKAEGEGLGLFIRSVIGIDREAAKEAFGAFLGDSNFTANQIHFLDIIINHLAEHGFMDPALLYDSPFTDLSARGPEGLFSSPQVDQLVAILGGISKRASGGA